MKAKQPKISKMAEVSQFRAEVQKYINTGKSDVLTAKEKYKLDGARKSSGSIGLWEKFVAYFHK